MSKKSLLSESAVRRFMKLADVSVLSDSFINERGGLYQADEDELEGMEPEMEEPAPEMDVTLRVTLRATI